MIQTEQTVQVDVAIDRVWDYVRDMARWASIMPGFREFEIIDDDNSRWIIKVGVGGLVRTVKVRVHVDEWDGPERVNFTFKLEGDPVKGGGTYRASRKSDHETEVILGVRVEGSGPMAPMWEAMGGPLLPTFAKAFAGQLKGEIEKAAGSPASPDAAMTKAPSLLARIRMWLGRLWRAVFGATPGL